MKIKSYKEILEGLIKDLENDINAESSCKDKLSSITLSVTGWKREKQEFEAKKVLGGF